MHLSHRLENAHDLLAGEARLLAGNDRGAELVDRSEHAVVQLRRRSVALLEGEERVDSLLKTADLAERIGECVADEGVGIESHSWTSLRKFHGWLPGGETDGETVFLSFVGWKGVGLALFVTPKKEAAISA